MEKLGMLLGICFVVVLLSVAISYLLILGIREAWHAFIRTIRNPNIDWTK